MERRSTSTGVSYGSVHVLAEKEEAAWSKARRKGGARRISSLLTRLKERIQLRRRSPASVNDFVRAAVQPSAPPMHLMVPEQGLSYTTSVSHDMRVASLPVQHVVHQEPCQQQLKQQHISVEQQPSVVQAGSCGDLSWLWDFYSIDWNPKEYHVKFRQHLQGYRIGANLRMTGLGKADPVGSGSSPLGLAVLGYQVQGLDTKLVLKPAATDRKWKIIWEPQYTDVRLLTKKIPLCPWVNLQVGLGHNFQDGTTGWKWKLTTSLWGSTVNQIQHKTSFPTCPGLDFRVGWNAEYSLPDIHGGLGTGEPILGMNIGHLHGSLERLEAIFTRRS